MVIVTVVLVDAPTLLVEIFVMLGRVVFVRMQAYDAFFDALNLLMFKLVFIGLLKFETIVPAGNGHGGVMMVTEVPLAATISTGSPQ